MGESFKIPCWSSAPGGYKLVPEDAADYTPITYTWEIITGSVSKDYPGNAIAEPKRVKLDPRTGIVPYTLRIVTFVLPSLALLHCKPYWHAYDRALWTCLSIILKHNPTIIVG